MRLKFEAIQEDMRKVGIAVVIAALAALFFGSSPLQHTLYVILFGLVVWLFGVIEFMDKEEKGEAE